MPMVVALLTGDIDSCCSRSSHPNLTIPVAPQITSVRWHIWKMRGGGGGLHDVMRGVELLQRPHAWPVSSTRLI